MQTSSRLAGRRVLITGAGRGIGAETARHVAAAGAELVLADLNLQGAEAVAASLRQGGAKISAYRLDVSDLQAVRALAARVAEEQGDICGMVNCAGVSLGERFEDADFLDKWRLSFSVNVDGTMYMIHSFLDHFKRTKGSIVNIASTCAFVSGNCPTGYAPTKAAVKLLTQTLARDLAPYGIRVNAVAPAVVATEMTLAQRADDAMTRNFEARSKLKRPAEAREIAAPIVMLLSGEASYMTGLTMPIDGGILI
ncbi:MAG: SDR family oxidoreductase [Rhizobiaceae bacterium]|nr:SDR family oxidoreductase [Rhizobiaceae bacterium]